MGRLLDGVVQKGITREMWKKKKKKDRQKDVGRVVVTAEMKKAGISEKRLAGTISHGKQCRGLQENVCLGTHVR